eukprot:CCRYP_006121-RA/>CCRYP_006121-RA protein AED:0.00 eAED:0.00 QI:2944/1/1/1/1/1/2/112/231
MFTRLMISTRTTLRRVTACHGNVSLNPLWPSLTSLHLPSRSLSSTPPSEDKDNVHNDPGKEEIIRKWMTWNRWKYEPNMEAIAKIGQKDAPPSPLDQFRDTVPKEKRAAEPVGRSWSVKELRRKSYEDLHKLWYVLYKERNMLLTESNLARRHGYMMVQPERRKKVRKSMGAIKHVLGERKREKIADHKLYLEELKRFDGLMAKMTFDDANDEMEEAMHTEANELKLEKLE